jgi:glycosyltransferase involved in cell wall biosynthesis
MIVFFIVTPSRNYGRFIGDSVESVRRQRDVGATRHHVQDGMSDDETLSVLEASTWSGLSWVSEQDSGQCDALNRGFARTPTTTAYLGWLNADEFYLPGALAEVHRAFEADPSLDVVYGDSVHVDADGRLRRLVAQHSFSRRAVRSLSHLYIQTSSTFYRRRVWEAGNLRLDVDFRQAMDQELYVRLDAIGLRFGYVPKALSGFRVHGEQLSVRNGPDVADREFRALAERAGYRHRPRAARLDHRLRKLAAGSYLREWRAMGHRDRQMRWFERDPAGSNDRARAATHVPIVTS